MFTITSSLKDKSGHPSRKDSAQRGSALVYILIAIALLAALTVSFMEPSSQQTSSQNTFKTISAVKGQVDVIMSSIQECVLLYPEGDLEAVQGGTDPGARLGYPIRPDSDYYSGSDPGSSDKPWAREIRCPGKTTSTNPRDHERIFSGNTGKFLPPPPDLFQDWQYYNGPDGVFFWTQTDKSDAFIESALEKLDENFSECEADLIDATSGAVDLDSGGTSDPARCPNNHLCFRVRMIINESSVYNGDDQGDEDSCP